MSALQFAGQFGHIPSTALCAAAVAAISGTGTLLADLSHCEDIWEMVCNWLSGDALCCMTVMTRLMMNF